MSLLLPQKALSLSSSVRILSPHKWNSLNGICGCALFFGSSFCRHRLKEQVLPIAPESIFTRVNDGPWALPTGETTLSRAGPLTWQFQEVGSPPLSSTLRCLEGQGADVLVGEDTCIGGVALHGVPGAAFSPGGQVGEASLRAAPASGLWLLELLWRGLHHERFAVGLRQVTGGLAVAPPASHHAVGTSAIQSVVGFVDCLSKEEVGGTKSSSNSSLSLWSRVSGGGVSTYLVAWIGRDIDGVSPLVLGLVDDIVLV